jgi:hypothetical protein
VNVFQDISQIKVLSGSISIMADAIKIIGRYIYCSKHIIFRLSSQRRDIKKDLIEGGALNI